MRWLVVIAFVAGCAHSGDKKHEPVVTAAASIGSGGPLDHVIRLTAIEDTPPGLQAVVLQHGKPILALAYGFSNLEERHRMTLDTTMRVGGVTAAFTAVAVAQLAAANRLRLDDSVHGYLELPTADDAITIRDLLAHRSGLHDYTDLVAKDTDAFDHTSAEILQLVAAAPLDFAPGSGAPRVDSPTDAYLLGLVVEDRTRLPFDAYLRDHVLADHAGPHTTLCGPSDAIGYEVGSNGNTSAEPQLAMSAGFAAAGACSTAPELARWFDAFAHGRIVPAAQLADTLATLTTDLYGHPRISIAGTLDGFSASATYLPELDTTIVILSNRYGTTAPLFAARLVRALLPNVAADTPIPAADAAALAGPWDHGLSLTVRGTSHVSAHLDDGTVENYRRVDSAYEDELAPTRTLRVLTDEVIITSPAGDQTHYQRLAP